MKNNTLLSLEDVWENISQVENKNKIKEFLHLVGVEFYDDEKEFIKDSSVKIVGIGGLKIDHFVDKDGNLKLEKISDLILEMPTNSFKMSYLNSSNFSKEEIVNKIFEFKHYSVLHTITLNILVSGVSTSVENEFCCQRDILHLSRITEARTNIQTNPPIVVLSENLLLKIKDIIKDYKTKISKIESDGDSKKDSLEAKNILFPSAKATAFILSGTIANFIKLCKFIEDDGKELEMKKVLRKINTILEDLLPQLKG